MKKSNRKRSIYLVTAIAIVVTIAAFVKLNSKDKDAAKDTTQSTNGTKMEANKEDEKTTESAPTSVTTNEIDEDTKEEINKLLDKYYDASVSDVKDALINHSKNENEEETAEGAEKREGIEAYKNRETQIKAGLEKDTYIVFSKYNMKFYNIDMLAPGMSILYVVKEEDGTFSIVSEPYSIEIDAYIEEILKEEEIQNAIDEVNQGLAKAMDKDEALKTFVRKLETAAKTESETKEE